MLKLGQKQRGFTIVELLIVIVVIAILAAISIVAYTGIQDRANAAKAASVAAQYEKIFKLYKSENGYYPRPNSSTACLGNVDDFPAEGVLGPGECARWGDGGWSAYSVNESFNDSLLVYVDQVPSADIRSVSRQGENSATYRGLIYYRGCCGTNSYADGYITYFLRGSQACPVGLSRSFDDITECKITLSGEPPDEWYWGGHGGEG